MRVFKQTTQWQSIRTKCFCQEARIFHFLLWNDITIEAFHYIVFGKGTCTWRLKDSWKELYFNNCSIQRTFLDMQRLAGMVSRKSKYNPVRIPSCLSKQRSCFVPLPALHNQSWHKFHRYICVFLQHLINVTHIFTEIHATLSVGFVP